ncbi:MAG: DASS family sodium-coupled anion symporter [Bacteroidetes bacterium]|nr:MAG: DASS family sodium-coupled anion symporter [Bacteroidota bacterium]
MRHLPNTKRTGLLLGPTLFALVLLYFHPEGLSDEANAVLASTLWVATWWITDCIPLAATSILPIILFPLTGGMSVEDTTSAFGHRYIFLYIGGFILAIAIERWNLHKRISLMVIHLIGTNLKMIILGFMVATAFLSMWISNTATAVMMLPIGMAIVSQLKDNPKTREDENLIFGKALMLSIAYSATIGGIATLIGTPPNLVLAAMVQELYGVEITFSRWIIFGLPISVVLLFLCWKYLTEYAFKFKQTNFPDGKEEIKRQLNALGSISFEEKLVLGVFFLTAVAWISRSFLNRFIPALDDTVIAVVAAILVFTLPASGKTRRALVTWDEAVKLPWGILLLFGGGLALADGFKSSGLATFLGQQLSLLEGASLLVLLLVVIAAVNFLTEITSNIATTAMVLPILAPLALVMNVHPYALMVGAAVAASCAFMLPVATPPNAVVFGSGYLTIPDMVRAGFRLNLMSIICLTLVIYLLLPYLWDFHLDAFPPEFKK